MRMNRWIALFLASFLVLNLAACASQATLVYAEGAEKDQVAAAAEPFAQHILDGILQNDYELFASDFDATMKSAMTQQQYDKIVKMFADYGEFQSRELTNIQVLDKYYRVNYQLTFGNKVVIMGIVIPSADLAAVSGLWFN